MTFTPSFTGGGAGIDSTAIHSGDAAGGSLGGTFPSSLTVTKLNETGGPTALTIGTIVDGQFLKRVGSTLVSASAGSATFLDQITVSGSAVQTRDFGAGGHGVNLAALTDGHIYEGICFFVPGTPASSQSFTLQPEAASTNQDCEGVFSSGGTAGGAGITDLRLAGSASNMNPAFCTFQFFSKAGFGRFFRSSYTYSNAGAVSVNTIYFGTWNVLPATTALTSLRIRGSLSDGLGVGTVLTLYDRGAI